ncbi:MAG TPA: aminoacyl-tRNA hydrolase [Candidatus Saccharimonadales bacterium]
MKLIFALGNPEKRYEQTRHNIGFEIIDAYAREHNASFQQKDKFKAEVAEVVVHGEKILLVKPTTYYNEVGESLRPLMDFYKVTPENTLIIHDDLALPFGTVRSRIGGSDAGNNGIKSINQHGGEQSNRLRIGIASSQRAVMGDVNFVLARFSLDETTQLTKIIVPGAIELVQSFLAGSFAPHSVKLVTTPALDQD